MLACKGIFAKPSILSPACKAGKSFAFEFCTAKSRRYYSITAK